MKILIVSIAILLLSGQVFGQKKSKVDPKDAQIDTLTKKLDSISKELVKYVGVYDTLKRKLFITILILLNIISDRFFIILRGLSSNC